MTESTAKSKRDPEPRGILCPKCGCGHFEVVYTRRIPHGAIRRRRECRYCGRRVTTLEVLQG